MQVEHMEWKQPDGLRRHWVLDELDGELLFMPMPVGAAQGRVGEDVYDLRDVGVLQKRRTLASNGLLLATLDRKAAGEGGTLRFAEREYAWKPESVFGTRWVLKDPDNKVVFSYIAKQGLGKGVRVEIGDRGRHGIGPMLLICWYVTVL
jgi:hypothetical protein